MLGNISKNHSSDIRRLIENFFSLAILQGVTYVLPLVTMPYLVRVLGVEKFGLIAFAQSFIQYFIIITDYGFDLSATRSIAINRYNEEKIQEIVSSVCIIKLMLMSICFFALVLSIVLVPQFNGNGSIYLLTFGMVLGNILFPTWFFQGMESMKYITVLNILAKLIFTVFIFVIVRSPDDYIYVPEITSLGYIISGLISMWIIFTRFKVKLCLPTIKIILSYFHESTHFFLSRVSVSIYTSSNVFFLGLFVNAQMAGYYSVAEKLYSALCSLYQPLNSGLYPYMSKTKNIGFYKKLFLLACTINTGICACFYFFSDDLISILCGEYFQLTKAVFKILLITVIIIVPSTLLGYPFLAALGYAKYVNNSVIMASIIHLIVLLVFSMFWSINIFIVAWMVLATQIIVFVFRIYPIYKNKLWDMKTY